MKTIYEALSLEENVEGNGCIILDAACYFPYKNQEILNFDATLIKNTSNIDDGIYFDDKKYNHRYPNKSYVTLSKKYGRKVSRLGYPILKSVDGLNQFDCLVFKVGLHDKATTFCVPVSIQLTQANPFAYIQLHADIENPDIIRFKICILHKTEEGCKYLCYKSHRGYNEEDDFILHPIININDIYTVCYEDKIKMEGVPATTDSLLFII